MFTKVRLALKARRMVKEFREVSKMNPNWWKGKTVIGAVIAALGPKLAKYGQALGAGQPVSTVELLQDLFEIGGIILAGVGVRHAIAKNGTGQ